ncbi:MAG: hypothetical protein V1772_06750, partial [Chloroflexota bacterium]
MRFQRAPACALIMAACLAASLAPPQPADALRPASAAASAPIIIDHTCTDLTKIPPAWLTTARNLAIHYAHTSHGQQLIQGISKLQELDSRYAFEIAYADSQPASPRPGGAGVLGIYDGNPPETYIEPDDYWATNGGRNRTRGVAGANVYGYSMWAWCGQQSENSAATVQAYLDALHAFESEYPAMRFVYMTGHTDGGGPSGTLYRNNNLVRDYVRS